VTGDRAGDAERIVRIAAEHKADVLDVWQAHSPLCGHVALHAELSTGSTVIACLSCERVGIRNRTGLVLGIDRVS